MATRHVTLPRYAVCSWVRFLLLGPSPSAKLLMNPQYKYGGVAVGDAKPGQPRLVVMQFVSESWTELQ